jgi:hypothetical protein
MEVFTSSFFCAAAKALKTSSGLLFCHRQPDLGQPEKSPRPAKRMILEEIDA